MYYVEFLRVVRTLRVIGYVFGAILLVALACRPFSHDNGFSDSRYAPAANAVPIVRQNSDGTTTKIYTDTRGEHVQVMTAQDGVQTITIERALRPGEHANRDARVAAGPLKIHSYSGRHSNVAVITRDLRIDLGILFLIAAAMAAVVATILGLALSRENDGHLELAWTKPASREAYALAAVCTDIGGILATGVAATLTMIAVLAIYGGVGFIHADSRTLSALVFAVFFALSYYGIVLAATSSMRRGALVLALLAPASLLLPAFTHIQWMSIGTIARSINTFNPAAYFDAFASSPDATTTFTLLPNGTALQILALAALFVLGLAASLVQWRRLEA